MKFLLHLVDVVWGEAKEDQSVPSTEWASRMIEKAIARHNQEAFSASCTGDCGMNYCNENGCIEQKRVSVEPNDLIAAHE